MKVIHWFTVLCCVVVVSCQHKKSVVAESTGNKQLWTCSMHPQVIRDKPGTCPICGMDLVPKMEHATAVHDVKLDDLLQPTDRFVVSSIPVTSVETSTALIEVEALGTIAYDTRMVSTISARVSGRIEKLYVHYRYQPVYRGQRIMDIYSPELLTAQEELIFLLKNDASNHSLISAARQKLLLLGMSESQLQQVIRTGKPSLTVAVYSNYSGHIHEAGDQMTAEKTSSGMDLSRITDELSVKEGTYVGKGQKIFQLYDASRSWVLLNIFPEYTAMVRKGDAVRVIPEAAPAKDFRAQIDFVEPVFRKENKTVAARVFFNNSQMRLPIGSQVKAVIFVQMKEANWLPKEAVLSLGMDKVVFKKESGGFKAHKIETGISYKHRIQITAGLLPADSVAANAQFLADSESFIKINRQQ